MGLFDFFKKPPSIEDFDTTPSRNIRFELTEDVLDINGAQLTLPCHKDVLKDIFGERILTLPRAADRNSIAGMQDALVELYVLSHTRKIMGSMQSSYSETAAQISNIRCELLTKKA